MENNNTQPTKVSKTWFIQRGSNEKDIFACDEKEAWGLFQNRSNWRRNDFKMIGVSDGQTYVKVLRDSQNEINQVRSEVEALSRDLTRYLDTRDNLKFKELLPDTDEKMKRVDALIKDLQDKVDAKNVILNNAQKYVVEKAFNAELEMARGKIEMPSNFDVMTPHGDRQKILNAMGK
jgi:type IV secretory pathway VirJ component